MERCRLRVIGKSIYTFSIQKVLPFKQFNITDSVVSQFESESCSMLRTRFGRDCQV